MYMMVRFEYIPAGAGYSLQKCAPETDALRTLQDLRRADAWITSATCFDFDSGYSAPWTVRGLSVRQPHAALIAAGRKQIETRPRRTSYRGPVLIHASRGEIPPEALQRPGLLDLSADLPDVRGAFIASAMLTGCVPITEEYAARLQAEDPAEYVAGYYTPGRFAWLLEDVQPFEPIPARGRPWLWKIAGEATRPC